MLLLALPLVTIGCASQPEHASVAAPPLPAEAARLIQQGQRALGQQAYTQALAWADSAVGAAPLAPDGYFLRGRIYFDLNRLAEAKEAYRRVQQLQSGYPGLAHNLGNIAFRERRFQEALRYYQQEAERQSDPNPWHGLGATHELLGNTEEARTAYEQALATDATYAPAHASLATWYEREGAFADALIHAHQALALDSTNMSYRYQVGALQHRTGAYEAAITQLRRVQEAQPWNYQAAFTLGQALQQYGAQAEGAALLERAGQLREAEREVERLKEAAQRNGRDIQAQVVYARALRRSGRLWEARGAYQRALSLRPGNLDLATNVATLNAQLGQRELAERQFRFILQRDSTHAEAWLNLGLVYAQAGQSQAANRAFQQAFRYGADQPAIQAFRQRMQARN